MKGDMRNQRMNLIEKKIASCAKVRENWQIDPSRRKSPESVEGVLHLVYGEFEGMRERRSTEG